MQVKVKIKEKAFEEAVARKNLTYLQLAKECGIHHVYLANVKSENLPHRPSAKLREKLLKILEVKFNKIFEIEK